MTIVGGSGPPASRRAVAHVTLANGSKFDLTARYVHGDRAAVVPSALVAESQKVRGAVVLFTGDSGSELQIRRDNKLLYSQILPAREALTKHDQSEKPTKPSFHSEVARVHPTAAEAISIPCVIFFERRPTALTGHER